MRLENRGNGTPFQAIRKKRETTFGGEGTRWDRVDIVVPDNPRGRSGSESRSSRLGLFSRRSNLTTTQPVSPAAPTAARCYPSQHRKRAEHDLMATEDPDETGISLFGPTRQSQTASRLDTIRPKSSCNLL